MTERKAPRQVKAASDPVSVNGARAPETAQATATADAAAANSQPTKHGRRSLAYSKVPKPQLSDEAPPSAKIYQGAPPGEKFFRVLFVEEMVMLKGCDEAGKPIVAFEEYYIVVYEGVNFLVSLGPE